MNQFVLICTDSSSGDEDWGLPTRLLTIVLKMVVRNVKSISEKEERVEVVLCSLCSYVRGRGFLAARKNA